MPVPAGIPDIERQSLRELATDRIRAAILDGTLQPGEHLNDGELQDWLGMSRTPIREALNDLARTGLVEMAAQKYTRVAVPDPAKRTEVLQTIGAMLGGVVRVTVADLTQENRQAVLEATDRVLAALPSRDIDEVTKIGWALIHQFMADCPNATLVSATEDVIDGLAFRIASTNDVDDVDWDLVDGAYAALRIGVAEGDAVAAELAIEQLYRLGEIE